MAAAEEQAKENETRVAEHARARHDLMKERVSRQESFHSFSLDMTHI